MKLEIETMPTQNKYVSISVSDIPVVDAKCEQRFAMGNMAAVGDAADDAWVDLCQKVYEIFGKVVNEDNTVGQICQTESIRRTGKCTVHVNLHGMKIKPIKERINNAVRNGELIVRDVYPTGPEYDRIRAMTMQPSSEGMSEVPTTIAKLVRDDYSDLDARNDGWKIWITEGNAEVDNWIIFVKFKDVKESQDIVFEGKLEDCKRIRDAFVKGGYQEAKI